jgi:hypothetical protein
MIQVHHASKPTNRIVAQLGDISRFQGESVVEDYADRSAATQVDAQPPTDIKWTVMVFMGTDTIEGNASLVEFAESDIEEMEAAGSGDGLNIFVQVHGNQAPWRQHIRRPDQRTRIAVPDAEHRLEAGAALSHFIEWALGEANHREQDRSMLVLWGHAYDFALGRRPTTGGLIDPLDFAELSAALRTLQERLQLRYEIEAAPRLDIVAFDACDLATVEVAYQLSSFARYLLASQLGVPLPGWPYDVILRRMRDPLDGVAMTPPELGRFIVRRYCETYPPSSPVSLTLLNLDLADEVFVHVQVLALLLASALGDPDTCQRITEVFAHSQTGPRRPYVDLADLCVGLMRAGGDTTLVEASRALGDVLAGARPAGQEPEPQCTWLPFIAEHARNSGAAARLNGVSIYAPHLVPELDAVAARTLYHRLEFATNTVWSELVHSLLKEELGLAEEERD